MTVHEGQILYGLSDEQARMKQEQKEKQYAAEAIRYIADEKILAIEAQKPTVTCSDAIRKQIFTTGKAKLLPARVIQRNIRQRFGEIDTSPDGHEWVRNNVPLEDIFVTPIQNRSEWSQWKNGEQTRNDAIDAIRAKADELIDGVWFNKEETNNHAYIEAMREFEVEVKQPVKRRRKAKKAKEETPDSGEETEAKTTPKKRPVKKKVAKKKKAADSDESGML